MKKVRQVVAKAASFTVAAADSGKVFTIGATDVVATLPSTASGLAFTFIVTTLSATTGFAASPAAADGINGGTVNKDLINTAATDVLGDAVTLVGTGTAGTGAWVTKSQIGTWAAES